MSRAAAACAPFGVSEYTTWPLTFEEDLALYQSLGVENIEVCEAKLEECNPHPQLKKLRASSLNVSSVQPRLHSLFPDQPRPHPSDPAERIERFKKSIALFGQYFPGTTLITISGAAPAGDYRRAFEVAVQQYRGLAQEAERHGVRIALEPLNPILMNVDTFVCTLQQADRIIAAVDHPAFGLFLDVWHVWEDPSGCDWIRGNGPRIFGVHINDWKTPRAFGDRHIPGEGDIPLAELLRAVRDGGYRGVYTLEIFSELRLEGSLWADPAKTVSTGQAAFHKLWTEVCA